MGPCALRCQGGDGLWTHSVNTSLLQARKTVGSCAPTCTPVCLASWTCSKSDPGWSQPVPGKRILCLSGPSHLWIWLVALTRYILALP